jgi:16S rRNA (cytosine967-C5)-methyltransferase
MEKFDLVSTHPVLVRGVTACLSDIFIGHYHADKVLERKFKRNRQWGSRDRRFIAETVYNMTRFWSLLVFFGDFKLPPRSEEDFLLLWAIYEAWQNNKNATPFLKDNFSLPIDWLLIQERLKLSPKEPWLKVAFPEWLYNLFGEQYCDQAPSLLASLNESAPVCLRANRLKITRDNLKVILASEKVETHLSEFSKDGLILNERQNVFITKAFKDGFFEVQDDASQMVSQLLSPKAGERIADMCAGAGGKTLHLAALMENKGSLLACDISEKKLLELKERARRGGVSNLRIQTIEGTKTIKRMEGSFNGVLIDAPCSGTGVMRRNPDTKWKISREELTRLKEIQSQILASYSKLVKPRGRLVYATCSLLREENQEQVETFLRSHSQFEKTSEAFISRPDTDKIDGFFAQLLIRK